MLEVEKWVIQNNPNFFVAELMKKKQSQLDLEQNIENIKQAELELLTIIQSEQTRLEEEKY